MIDLRLGESLWPTGLPPLADDAVDVTMSDPPFDARTHGVVAEADDAKGAGAGSLCRSRR